MAHAPSTYRGQERERGQGMAEYALILSLVAIVVIVALQFFGNSVNGLMSTVGKSI